MSQRNLGQFEHSRLQGLILMSLGAHEADWHVLILPEQRLKVRPFMYRVPDVMVISAEAPRTPAIEHPPLLREASLHLLGRGFA